MVGLTQEPALDPVTIGGLSVKQVIIRRKGEGATAVILFAVTDKLSVPIGFDVTLRLAGESIPCGSLFNGKPDAHSGTSSLREVSAEVSLPNPQVTEADIILTPNVKLIERDPSVDQVWGKDILFDHVPLSRQDLAAGPEKY
ncbi:MAG: hypothetical protein NT154_05135 [Verrucomicrobia bacterium]|nr:hypothetical protein [Verrucomicrobiota bacterium]